MGYLDTMLAGNLPFSVSSSNVTLSAANVRNCNLRFTGTLTGNIVVAPDAGVLFLGFYYFENLTTGDFTVTVQNGAGSVLLPQGRRGVLFVDATNGPRVMAGGNGDVPTGAKTLFYNTAAPSGWTAVALNDYALKIVTEGGGGVTSGTVAYSTLFARTATDAHTLTVPEIPLHGHPFRANPNSASGVQSFGGFAYRVGGGSGPQNYAAFTGTLSDTPGEQITGTGGGDSHTHDLDMRVQTAAFTLAARD